MRNKWISKTRRIVIKVGSGLMVKDGLLHLKFVRTLVRQVATLKEQGYDVVLVSSGAIGAGVQTLKASSYKSSRELSVIQKQAAAAVGQSRLMQAYDTLFQKKGIVTAQVLVTRNDLQERSPGIHVRHTLNELIKEGVVPIVNENDTVAVDEIKFGDNDTLAALVTDFVKAQLLVILTTVDGLIDFKTKEVISEVQKIDGQIKKLVTKETHPLGTGGMKSKLDAAKVVMGMGKAMVIAGGQVSNVLLNVMQGKEIGTFFVKNSKLSGGAS